METTTFTFTGDHEKFTVPAGVEILEVTVEGAGSGVREGGVVTGKMRVNPRDDLWIAVGKAGNARSGSADRNGGSIAFGGGGQGGDGTGDGKGGNGGGGASSIRINSRDGRIRVVAGGAGGASADSGAGGDGGNEVGEGGQAGVNGTGTAGQPTGGSQSQPGQAGSSSLGADFYGRDGEFERLGRGGKGGSFTGVNVNGGGGGGGGFYPGGGGAAGREDIAPATGGAGGSNYTGGLYNVTATRGGNAGNGRVVITWMDPDDPGQPPVPPDAITIDGQPIENALATKATDFVILRGTPDDPDAKNGVRLLVRMSRNKQFTRYRSIKGTYDETEERDHVRLDELEQDTRYYLRIHTQDHHGNISPNYRSTNFWTNRSPKPPIMQGPAENSQVTTLVSVTFDWDHVDDDPSDSQTAFRLRYRRARTPMRDPGEWTLVQQVTAFEEWTVGAGEFKGNTLYEWQIKTRDEQQKWGEWSGTRSFYVTADATSPILLDPINGQGIVAVDPYTFYWHFQSPLNGQTQERADLRYRVVGTLDWITLTGDSLEPGPEWEWTMPGDTFAVGYHYEWQMRTYGEGELPSDWTESEFFYGVAAPDSGPGVILVDSGHPQRPLGIGHNRVFIYDRGGIIRRGEITNASMVRWGRKRDDISSAHVVANSLTEAERNLLREVRTWQNEVVVYRDDERVFEGPITRIADNGLVLEIEAKDVMAYVYRRIMRQGYNDSYRLLNGLQLGQKTVVERSSQIIMNCLAYDDPNVLQYLTPMYAADDAVTSRIVKDFTKTAWEEIDDLAATAGLDYVTSGRRIILWDTHRALGRLPEMRDGDFSASPIVTEYGMAAANVFATTNNDGVYGYTTKIDPLEGVGPTGFIEQLASAYGESEATGTQRELTRADRRRLKESLRDQSKRNIDGRWPPPLMVRVPDNASLSPDLNVGINQLVPGVWIPVRAQRVIRELSQWQKLDSMTVEQTEAGETVSVVMSPAPNGGQDPDADLALIEEAT